MKKFRFHLQAVLDIRAERLRQAQLAFAVEEQKRMKIIHQIDEVQHGIERAFDDYNDLTDRGLLPLVSSELFSAYIQRQRQQVVGLTAKKQQQEKEMTSAREFLRQSLAQHRSMELLKEKHWKQYLKEIDKQEEETLAEIALNQYRKGIS